MESPLSLPFLGAVPLDQIASSVPARTLAYFGVCSKETLSVSHAHWHRHLTELLDRRHGGVSFPKLRGLVGAIARVEYAHCMGGFQNAMQGASASPPTAQQVLNFVARVRSHHSWYKHLPIEKGIIFQLGMSPVAGMRFQTDGYVEYVRGDGTEFHYTWETTKSYRDKFHFFIWRELPQHAADYQWMTDTADLARPLLVPNLSGSCVPVTANIHTHSHNYNLLQTTYARYKELQAQAIPDLSTLGSATTRWTRHKTGKGLPDEVLLDFETLHAFEAKHPQDTWCDARDCPGSVVLEDARQVCRSLFPFYTEEAIDLEVRMLLSYGSKRFSGSVSDSAVRAEASRGQVRLIGALLALVRFVWGDEAVPEVSLSMTSEQMRDLKRALR